MSKKVEIELRLPVEAIAEVQAVAKIAGVAVSTVINVMLAMMVRKHTNQDQQP